LNTHTREHQDVSIEHAPDAATVAMKAAVVAERGGITVAAVSGAGQILGMTPDQWAVVGVIAGIVIGFVGMAAKVLMDWHFRSQHLKLAEKRARALVGETEPGGLE